MTTPLLSRAESSALKGIGILCIMLHNYCHFLGFAVKENEYTFDPAKPMMLWDRLATLNHDLFVHLFSFFGHYGVPLFLFVSGFGLVMKYEREQAPRVAPLPFVRFHYLKLLRLMFLGYIAFAVVSYMHPQGYHGYTVGRVVAQLLMYINFLPDPDHIIKPGPYWYFSLMMQLYILYRLLFYRAPSRYVAVMIAVCWLLEVCCEQDFDSMNRVRYNFFGAVLPFGMGILYARHGHDVSRATWLGVLILSVSMVFFLGFSFQGWLWCPAFVVMGAVAAVRLLPSAALRPVEWVGGISAAMFVVHPITREIIIPLSFRGHVYTGIAIYVVVTVLLSWAFRHALRLIPSPKL